MNPGSTSRISPATYFLRYLVGGIFLLAAFLLFGKHLLRGADGAHYLAAGIFIINFLVVVGFTLAILRSEDLLADQDAPDLAYYLGFSLTVTALSATFLTDIGLLSSNDNARSRLVTGALAQFGAGLLATLIGLCAKILLASRQQVIHVNPDEYYHRVRRELGDLSVTVRTVVSEISSAMSAAADSIRDAGESARTVVSQLSESLKKGSEAVGENLNPERISKPVLGFIAELERLNVPAESVRISLGMVEKSAKDLGSGLKDATADARIAVAAAQAAGQAMAGITAQSERLKDATGRLVDAIDAQTSAQSEVSTAMVGSKEQIAALNESMGGLGEGFHEFRTSMTRSRTIIVKAIDVTADKMVFLHEGAEKVTASLSGIQGVVPILEQSVKALSEAFQRHSEAEHDIAIGLGEVNRLVPSLSSDIQALRSSLGALSGAIAPVGEELTGVVLRTTTGVTNLTNEVEKLTPALVRLSVSGAPVGESLRRLNAPLAVASDSLGDLNRAINLTSEQARALQDVVDRLRVAAQAPFVGPG